MSNDNSSLFKLQIVGLDGQNRELEGCSESDTIHKIKRRVESTGGLRVGQQKLFASGSEVPLPNQSTLKAAGLPDDMNQLFLIVGYSITWRVGDEEHEVDIFGDFDDHGVGRADLTMNLDQEQDMHRWNVGSGSGVAIKTI